MLMARYGAVCDNLLATEVVLADGRLVAANPREHADLFWAIRGGGGNFGIVTSFEYQLFRLDSVLSGLFYFPVSRTADVLHVYRNVIAEAPDELQTAGGLTGTPEGPAVIVAFCYCGVLALHNSLQPHAEGVYVNNLEEEGEARMREVQRAIRIWSAGPLTRWIDDQAFT